MRTFPILQHAYYLDYKVCHASVWLLIKSICNQLIFQDFFWQNDKVKYVNVFMNHLVSWNAAMARMARAQAFVNLGEPKIPVA